MMRRLMLTMVCGLSLSALGSAQQPPRDTTANALGTAVPASLSGAVVIDDASSTPARRAIVTLQSKVNGATFSEVADAAGRFAFAAVPPGEYDLIISKPAFVTTTYGARQPGRPGTPVVLVPGQALSDVRAVLMRGAVITGTVRMADGSPLKNTPVIVIRAKDGAAAQSVDTDDRGVYRVFGLAPADYLVSAIPGGGPPGGEAVRRAAAELDALVQALKEQRGRAAGAPAQEETPPARPGVRMDYAPTYFPGVTNITLATPITTAPGVVRDNVDFTVEMVPTAAVTGIVTGVNGQPAVNANLMLTAMTPPGMAAPLNRYGLGRRPDAQGRFTIAGVPPGQYFLEATSGGLSPGVSPANAPTDVAWASAPVSINGVDQHVNVVLQPAPALDGRIVLAGSTAPPANLSTVRLGLEAAGQRRVSRATTAADGTFRFAGVLPDTYVWTVTLPPAISRQWSVQSITANGRELRDAPMQVRMDAPLGPVQVVLTDTPTQLEGTLAVPAGQSPAAYDVILFAADRALWHAASPRIRLLRPGTNGSFSARDLLPGAYRLAAITASDDDEWKTTAFLESLMDASIPVTVTSGQVTRQDVRVQSPES